MGALKSARKKSPAKRRVVKSPNRVLKRSLSKKSMTRRSHSKTRSPARTHSKKRSPARTHSKKRSPARTKRSLSKTKRSLSKTKTKTNTPIHNISNHKTGGFLWGKNATTKEYENKTSTGGLLGKIKIAVANTGVALKNGYINVSNTARNSLQGTANAAHNTAAKLNMALTGTDACIRSCNAIENDTEFENCLNTKCIQDKYIGSQESEKVQYETETTDLNQKKVDAKAARAEKAGKAEKEAEEKKTEADKKAQIKKK